MKTILFFITIFFADTSLLRSEPFSKDTIGMSIIEKDVHITSKSSCFEINVEISNTYKEGFILYSFRRAFISPLSDDSVFFDYLNRAQLGAGTCGFLLDQTGKNIPIEFDDCDDCEGHDSSSHRQDFPQVFQDSVKNMYSRNTQYLNGNNRKIVKLKVELGNAVVKKGIYQIYLIYYCGNDIADIISENQLKENERKHKMMTFKGWIKSNAIKIFVD